MRRIALFVVVVLIVASCSVLRNRQQIAVPTEPEGQITVDDITRTYNVFVPDNVSDQPALIVALHGGGGNAVQAEESFGLDDVAAREGFIVVYPEGVGATVLGTTLATWNAGHCCGNAMEDDVDDTAFIDALIDRMITDYAIDEDRVYVTGHSNGALMTYRLACELSDRIAAIAPVSGQGISVPCSPSKPMPILHIHGTADQCMLYEGGTCGGCFNDYMQSLGLPVGDGYTWQCPSVSDAIKEWREINGCDDRSTTLQTYGSVSCETHDRCNDDAEITLCTVEGGGHVWPGADVSGPCTDRPRSRACAVWKETVGAPVNDINAAEMMWSFFAKHTR